MPGGCLLRWVVAGSLLACSGVPEEDPGSRAEQPPAPASSETARAAADRTVEPVVYVEGEFPHRAHAGIECAVCHGAMPGHATHGLARCTDCHVPPPQDTVAGVSPAECAACHHAAGQRRPCTHCHVPAQAALRVRTTFHVAGSAVGAERSLSFEHAPHAAIECLTCHTRDVTLAVGRDCASCHVDHHATDSNCSACHAPMPLSTHDVGSHRTCAGSGCHRSAAPLAAPGPRNICLVCHREQVDHEPDGECRDCHLMGGAAS